MASSWGEGASEEKAGLTGARKAAQSGACPPRLGDSVRGSLRREQDARKETQTLWAWPSPPPHPTPRIQSRSRPRWPSSDQGSRVL